MRVYGTINLGALHHNLTIAKQLARSARVMAVVKKDAYGHGLVRVAKSLEPRVDGFAVASIQEGVLLKEVGITKPVCVLSGFFSPRHIEPLEAYSLHPVVHCQDQLDILAAEKFDLLKIWMKLDTGMNRLGFSTQDWTHTMCQITQNQSLQLTGIMTHFACADDLGSDFTNVQIDLFNRCTKHWDGAVSLANSAGLLRWPKSQIGWVRPGIMLYGASPFASICAEELGLQPVMELFSTIIAIKTLDAGAGVGYGLTWKAPKKSRIAIVAAGYGDGYHRQASGRASVIISKQQAQLVGRVSMDSFAIDITDIEDATLGSPVKLFGQGLPVEHLAASAGTLPYEIFTSLNPHTVSLIDHESFSQSATIH